MIDFLTTLIGTMMLLCLTCIATWTFLELEARMSEEYGLSPIMAVIADIRAINDQLSQRLRDYPQGYRYIKRGHNGRFIKRILVPKEES
jgi:hypothetical protein